MCLGSSLHVWFTMQYVGLYIATAFFCYMVYLNADSYGTEWVPQKYMNVIQKANEVINGNADENKTLVDDIERGKKD